MAQTYLQHIAHRLGSGSIQLDCGIGHSLPQSPGSVMNQLSPLSSFVAVDQIEAPSAEYEVRFVESGAFTCKFILGKTDENATCCGAPTDGKSWCRYHRSIVFNTIPHRPR
jgi:hypothetical protein